MGGRWFGARALVALALVFGAPALAASCQSIAGIEDRTLGQCGEFCDTVMHNCQGANLVYETRAKCMGLCKLFDVGDPTEPQDTNTLNCRLLEARAAASASDEAISDHCRSAGPEGLNCGGGCESYCTVYQRACGVQCGSLQNCITKCAALRNKTSFSVDGDYTGNTLQCRLVHVTNATVAANQAERDLHCNHHALLSTPDDACIDTDAPPDAGVDGSADTTDDDPGKLTMPDCPAYCRVNGVSCQGDDQQYETPEQCAAVCQYFVVGKLSDEDQNTLGCRLYHSYNALCDPATHCAHTGPGGEGHCGTTLADKCLSYCNLARNVCPSGYKTAYANDDDACATDCATLPDAEFTNDPNAGTRYNVNYAASPATLACRFLGLSRAAVIGKDSALCSSDAFGKGDCAAP